MCIIISVPITMAKFPSSMLSLPETNIFSFGILIPFYVVLESHSANHQMEYLAYTLKIFGYFSVFLIGL